MAAEIKSHMGLEAELIAGSKGIFDILVQGKKIFSKYEVGRFPNEGEAAELVEQTLA